MPTYNGVHVCVSVVSVYIMMRMFEQYSSLCLAAVPLSCTLDRPVDSRNGYCSTLSSSLDGISLETVNTSKDGGADNNVKIR